MRKRELLFLAVLAAATPCAAEPTTQPFTPGPDTTIITGPLRPDGTIDYVAAINQRLSQGVTTDNNAAVILLQVFEPTGKVPEELAALGVKQPALAQPMRSLPHFAQDQHLDVTPDALGNQEIEARQRPWKDEEFPAIAAWLDANKAGLALIRTGADRPRYFVPWVPDAQGDNVLSALPSPVSLMDDRDVLLCAAMRSAGAKDVAAALADLRQVRKLGELETQGRTEISVLVGKAASDAAWKAYAAMVTKMSLTDEQLAAVRRELEDRTIDPPARPPIDVEYLLAPATVMSCIAGDAQPFLRALALVFMPDERVDPGDLFSADWDTVLKTVHAKSAAIAAALDLPTFAQRQAALEKLPTGETLPAAAVEDIGTPKTKAALEAFLKRKPQESREAYSARVADVFALSPEQMKRYDRVLEARELRRRMTLLAVLLEQYRRKNGAFPAALKDLGPALDTSDPLSGQALMYYPADGGYTLKSVGVNGKDDAGKDDDIVISVSK